MLRINHMPQKSSCSGVAMKETAARHAPAETILDAFADEMPDDGTILYGHRRLERNQLVAATPAGAQPGDSRNGTEHETSHDHGCPLESETKFDQERGSARQSSDIPDPETQPQADGKLGMPRNVPSPPFDGQCIWSAPTFGGRAAQNRFGQRGADPQPPCPATSRGTVTLNPERDSIITTHWLVTIFNRWPHDRGDNYLDAHRVRRPRCRPAPP
jgi:hypothetical protein